MSNQRGSPVVVGATASCEIYARKLLGPAFKMVGYETLPVPSAKKWNFIVTARHRQNPTLDVVFSFVINDDEAKKIIANGFESVYNLPNTVQKSIALDKEDS